jgi:hypothetical protein
MKIAYVILILIAFHYKVYAQNNNNPFAAMEYDSIVIYDFNPQGESVEQSSIIAKKNKLVTTIKNRKTLTHTESSELTDILGLASSYGETTAACYEPHLGIVYYKKGKVLAHLTICMDCNRLVSSMDIPNQKQGRQESANGKVYYNLNGMSKSLRVHLNKLLNEYKFSHTSEN